MGYRRQDEETLHSRIDVKDLGLTVIYLWCRGEATGGGDGWRVAEVLPLDDREEEEESTWCGTVEEANEACQQRKTSIIPSGIPSTNTNGIRPNPAVNEDVEDDENDDDYWAQYDNAPASTPGPPQPHPPPSTSRTQKHARTTSEADYFSRYADIQPEMDSDDPSTDPNTIGESSLNGNIITPASRSNPSPLNQTRPDPGIDTEIETKTETPIYIHSPTATEHPRPSSSDTNSSSAIVDRLEGSATMQSKTELAVRQHIASSMKSLYRLARSTGMGMGEFEGTISRELEVLGIEEDMEGG